jgi:lipoic acid synthetase
MTAASTSVSRLPEWARKGSPLAPAARPLRVLLRDQQLTTVCEEARCPNLGECFARGTATFMLLGDRCTRRCGYCSVETGRPLPPDPGEPARVAEAAARLGLRHVVLTAVARDDLGDGGALQMARTVRAVRRRLPAAKVEVLTPDYKGDPEALAAILDAAPDVFNHNIEMAPRLFPGQYLRPTREHAPVDRYVTPEGFRALESRARGMGFPTVYAGVFVRSSFNAEEVFRSGPIPG